jgi:hypothetical protein
MVDTKYGSSTILHIYTKFEGIHDFVHLGDQIGNDRMDILGFD